ncbi:MAG TPA: malto-oligosyltrehalose trehalohydrolase [Syntrophales bacterium]|nr:malto-oligosyltrehalose trehalohydrolase [Syntrophales bacterium]
MKYDSNLGAVPVGGAAYRFRVWAPLVRRIVLRITSSSTLTIPMTRVSRGYHECTAEGVRPGGLYLYQLDGVKEYPDPCSRSQLHGVHGPSQIIDSDFPWEDQAWAGIPFQNYLIYELHIGTFTPGGTFQSAIGCLDHLKDLGITAVGLMPVAQFPGDRNWGYDGVYLFAVQNSYGGAVNMKRFVNACHLKGIAVILDVVYNHLGPEGNYLGAFGPYFTDRYRVPWGLAVNFDGQESDEVRRFFIENALYWITEFHVDALRIDAVHAIMDFSAQPFLQQLSEAVRQRADELNRRVYLIGESSLNDARLVCPRENGGIGLDAQWNDDFHHALHVLLTGEDVGYYRDFGHIEDLVTAYREGFIYSGQYSRYRKRSHGNSSWRVPARRFVVCSQNHDQVGNRAKGERLSSLISFEALKLAAGVVLLSPFVPLLFMGEEYAEKAPFLYFVSHSDPQLIEAVRKGRKEEFAHFHWPEEPPDPQTEETYRRSCLHLGLAQEGSHKILFSFYRELIRVRKETEALRCLSKKSLQAVGYEKSRVLFLRRWTGTEEVAMIFHFGKTPVSLIIPLEDYSWEKVLDSSETRWGGPGLSSCERLDDGSFSVSLSPKAFVLYSRRKEE